MQRLKIGVLFGGVSPEHEVSARSAASILRNMNPEKYEAFPVGITRDGRWKLFTGTDYGLLEKDGWQTHPGNLPAVISPDRSHGLLIFHDGVPVYEKLDCVFPVLHGENGEDGTVQGLLMLAGIPFVGSGVASSANCMDKATTHMMADNNNIRQAGWESFATEDFARRPESYTAHLERRFGYPLFIKPARTGSSVGISKVKDRQGLLEAVALAGKYDGKVIAEEYIEGREIEVSVLGNREPVASICGEIIPGAEFYTYEEKYITDTAQLVVPAALDDATSELLRETAVRVYRMMECKGLARVDFFVAKTGAVVLNEINTIPGFTSISMYPKLFEASGIAYCTLIDRLIELAMEKK